MNFFRNPYLAAFMALLILFMSCSKTDAPFPSNSLDAKTLKSIHLDIKSKLNTSIINHSDILKIQASNPTIEDDFLANLNYIQEHGIEGIFYKYGIDLEILSEFDFYFENESNENLYEMLVSEFNFQNNEEAVFLFNLIEIYKIFETNLSQQDENILKKNEGLTWGCALALAGTVAVTAGAAFITGGASLIVFLISKGIATASIINACS